LPDCSIVEETKKSLPTSLSLNYSQKMPTLFIITAISGAYPDIAVIPEKYFFKKEFLYSLAFFTLRASQSHYIGFVAAHSR